MKTNREAVLEAYYDEVKNLFRVMWMNAAAGESNHVYYEKFRRSFRLLVKMRDEVLKIIDAEEKREDPNAALPQHRA